jgi:hypothetical protein
MGVGVAQSRGTSGLKSATKNFKPLAPPEPRDAVIMIIIIIHMLMPVSMTVLHI